MSFIQQLFTPARRVPPLALGLALLCLAMANPLQARTLTPIHHALQIELNPDTHAITGLDTIHLLPSHRDNSSVSFILHPQLTIDQIEFNDTLLPIPHSSDDAVLQPPSTRRVIEIPLPPLDRPDEPAILTLRYHGQIDDTPKASGGLRFVKPDDTNGHIGPNGVYLTHETFWHPTWEETLSTYDLTLRLPSDWEAITQGQEIANGVTDGHRTIQWRVSLPSEALTLAANHFVVQKQVWKGIQLATYLYPEDAHLASQYIEATIGYLQMYTDLLGPYPFSKFAVVENFFPSGLGLPSFTLLGEGVIQRGYTQPYSLGHEIVHSWFGNSVFNDFAQGNWVEGLTTYLSNYYYDEAKGHQQEAFNTRRRMIYEYNLYTEPDKEYPVRAFHHKETRLDNAIGYQKTAMVFHMLRQEMGDVAFFNGVRRIIREGTGSYLKWNDLLRIFSKSAERDLGWFFHQWIDQPGAPNLDIQDILVQEDPTQRRPFTITGTILQAEPLFTIRLPLHLNLQGGLIHDSVLDVDQANQSFTLRLPASPTTLAIDPEHHLLLHLHRAQIPPMLNQWETDPRRILIRPQTMTTDEAQSLDPLLQRLETQPGIETIQSDDPGISESASYLVIGPPARRLLESGSFSCEKSMGMHPGRLSIDEQTFEGPEMAFLISCAHPRDANHTVTFFFGWSPEAVKPVSRLLFFYGWDSYLVFKQGKVIARGMFQPVHSASEIIRYSP
ncbi:MAG: M1 family aminopeptidase [Nitrospirales bacterium]|nr:hypothetical protein [Nitrospirales bacterium]